MARTDSFKVQHQKALELAKAIDQRLVPPSTVTDAQAVAMDLAKLLGVLQVHLNMEDRALYPSLMESGNATTKATAEKFMREMGGIGEAFTAYAKEWNASAIRANPEGFITQTKKVFTILGDRIKREEAELYPLADEL